MTTTSLALNPYAQRGMIRDPAQFVGRSRELNEIFSRLATMQSVSVVGETGIGLSSLLYHIALTGRDRLGSDYVFHYLDLQRVFSSEEFYERACELLGTEGNDHRDFEQAIHGKKIVLCLDVFEQTAENPAFGDEFFNALRSLAQTGELALVVATQRMLSEIFRDRATPMSPFFNIFAVLRLGPLTEAEARELVTRPVERNGQSFSEPEVDFILSLAGTHPYRLNVACELFYEAKLSGHVDFTQVRRRFEAEVMNGKPSFPHPPPPPPVPVVKSAVGLQIAAILMAIGGFLGWFSMQDSNPVGIFFAGGILLIALGLLANDWVQALRWRGRTQ